MFVIFSWFGELCGGLYSQAVVGSSQAETRNQERPGSPADKAPSPCDPAEQTKGDFLGCLGPPLS